MTSGPEALDGSSPASSFKIPASDISIRGISGTLGLNVPGMFSSLREPSASPSSMVFSESWFSLRGETGVKTDCRWLLIRFALSVLDVCTSLVWGHGADQYLMSPGVSFSTQVAIVCLFDQSRYHVMGTMNCFLCLGLTAKTQMA